MWNVIELAKTKSMLHCYIIDDELPAINILKSYVQKTPDLELVGSNTNALEALTIFKDETKSVYI